MTRINEDVIYLVGRYAVKLGYDEKAIRNWVAVNYGKIFVRSSLLRPPFSAKEISNLLLKVMTTGKLIPQQIN